MTKAISAHAATKAKDDELSSLMNVGPATSRRFHLLKIETISDLAKQEADELFAQLCALSQDRVDPCA
ncbi:helix-hairpin-helix domain-containing protein [Yoonia sp. SDW83-1]|uniref:helix-hairpin-helix domain-containing protein n=1 Tax=Yoonia sp. SDW83-1 TaxID=3366945 RepID=UPI00398C8306